MPTECVISRSFSSRLFWSYLSIIKRNKENCTHSLTLIVLNLLQDGLHSPLSNKWVCAMNIEFRRSIIPFNRVVLNSHCLQIRLVPTIWVGCYCSFSAMLCAIDELIRSINFIISKEEQKVNNVFTCVWNPFIFEGDNACVKFEKTKS